jgi:hypothetical protein
VTKAYADGKYTTKTSHVWQRGMDGWFNDSTPSTIHVIHHHDMVSLIEQENPQ